MIDSIVRFFLDPFNILWMLSLGMIVAWVVKKETWLKWLIISTACLFFIVATPLVPVLLVNSLEDRYVPLDVTHLPDSDAEYHILVLGSGHGFDERLPPNSLLSANALGRLTEGVRLHRKLPNSKLVLSGSTSTPGRTTQADMLMQTALLLGVESESMIIQSEPRSTCQEARVYTEIQGMDHPLILVTSAMHMPRALYLFNEFGVEPIPSPANYRLKGSWKKKRFGWPSVDNIQMIKASLLSYAAITQAKLSSRIGSGCG